MPDDAQTTQPPTAAAPAPAPVVSDDDAAFDEAVAGIEKRRESAKPRSLNDAEPEGPAAEPEQDASAATGAAAVAPAAAEPAPAAAQPQQKPGEVLAESLKVDGKTPEEITEKVNALAKKLGMDKDEAALLLKHNMEKRWRDTRLSLTQVERENAELKKKLAEIEASKTSKKPDSPAAAAQDSGEEDEGDDFLGELSDDEKLVLDDTPQLRSILKKLEKRQRQVAEALSKKVVEEKTVESTQALDAVRAAEAKTAWKNGIEAEIQGGTELYHSPEFIDWERQNITRLSSLFGHFDKYDPLGAIQEIKLYQKERAQAEADRKKKESVIAATTVVKGKTTPPADRVGSDDSDEDAMWAEANRRIEAKRKARK